MSMTIIAREHFIEITADEGKTLHRKDADGIYCKQACSPLDADTTVWEEVRDEDVPSEDEEGDDYYTEAGKILLGKETE